MGFPTNCHLDYKNLVKQGLILLRTMIISFLNLHMEIGDILSAKNLLQMIEDVDVTVMQVLVKFLTPLHAAAKAH